MKNTKQESFSHIIWDWNGTLLNDTWLCVDIVNGLLKVRNLPEVSLDRYLDIFDFPVKEYYSKLGFDFTAESYSQLAAVFIAEYERRRLECTLHAGVTKTLRRLKECGYRQMVLSAYAQDALVSILSHFGLSGYFDAVYGLDNFYAAGKESLGRTLIARENIAPSSALMIGDTTHDYAVARSIGVPCALVATGHQSRRRLEQCGVVVHDTLEEIGAGLQEWVA